MRISDWSSDVCSSDLQRDRHHGDAQRHHIGFEKIGRHAGTIADIVADIVGDGRGVARIVFGASGLDLAHQVGADVGGLGKDAAARSEEHTSELQSLMRTSYAVFCLKKKK